MSPAPWGETSHLAAAVIVTRAHCCLTAADHCYVMLRTIKFVDKSVNDDSACRLDHCDIIASRNGFGVPMGVPHSEVELQTELKSFTAAHLGSNTNQHTGWTLGSTCTKSSRSVYASHLVQSLQLLLFKVQRGWQCSLDFQEQDGRDSGSVRAMRYEFPWKYREFVSFVL